MEAAPRPGVVGTDWPHPNIKGPVPDEFDLLALLRQIAPEPTCSTAFLVDNPARLYGFWPLVCQEKAGLKALMRKIEHFIHASLFRAPADVLPIVFNPATGEVDAQVALANAADLQAAVDSAKKAQPGWAATNPQRRARVMMKFVELLNAILKPLAELMSREHGKTVADSIGDLQRGLEVGGIRHRHSAAWQG